MNDYLSMITNACALITMSYLVVKLKKRTEAYEYIAVPLFTGIAAVLVMMIPPGARIDLSLGYAPLVMASMRYGLGTGLLSVIVPALFGAAVQDMTVFQLLRELLLPVLISSLFHRGIRNDPTAPLRVSDGISISGLLLLVRLSDWAYDSGVRTQWWVTSNLIAFAVSSAVLVILIVMFNDENRSQLVQRRLELQANQDGLTGLPNLYNFMNMAKGAIRRQRIAIFMVDIDDFKLYNDSFGHLQGDDLLREVGTILQQTIGIGDYVARYGGEEFIILCHEQDPERLCEVAGRLCRTVEEHTFSLEEQYSVRNITISIGVALSDGVTKDLKALIEKADKALYISKKSGKNRFTFYADPLDDGAARVNLT
ncbi:GGDEF domain-containing protein [Gorillibacterium sp. sgz500922]|uniref:GGDEF domain-containing protein n=1 Tax=Gorillibacterium sp. sgz500922 TaxID=3446694 RepID=UPI003F67D1C9